MHRPQDATPDTASPSALSAVVALSIGNTRAQLGVVRDGACGEAASLDVADTQLIADKAAELTAATDGPLPIAVASVNPGALVKIEKALKATPTGAVSVLGRDIPIHIHHALTESGERTVGHDRLAAAIGAFERLKQACVVVDLGTAVTIDFVDGEGTFHGGAILPGLTMMLKSLHQGTAALPELTYQLPDPGSSAPGNQTDAAIMLGLWGAVRGAVRILTERYAEHYGAYPKVIATGGDLGILEDEELVDERVPDLQLLGIAAACARALAAEHDTDDDDDD